MSNTCLPPRSRCTPGLRFHPTDIELTLYHLKRKLRGKQNAFIADVDIYKHDPWELPAMSCSITKDLAWYFFCLRERKYPNGNRAKRDAKSGSWKTTGNDRDIRHEGNIVGKIKTLIFHNGGANNGSRRDWVMHEYRLIDQCTYVVCKVYEKSGLGPRNGAQYGAVFNEEEWNDDEELDDVVSPPLACVSGPAVSLQNTLENSVMKSTFTPANRCTGSSSKSISFKSVQHAEFIPPLACVSGPAVSLQNTLENSVMKSTFTPANRCTGSSSKSISFKSVQHAEFIPPLACVSGPAILLQNTLENSVMKSTFTPENRCTGSSSKSISFKSVQHAEFIPVFGDEVFFDKYSGISLDDLNSQLDASAHDNYESEDNSLMGSTFQTGNICIGSSSNSSFLKSVLPAVNISRPVDHLNSPPGASTHYKYGRENMNGVYEDLPNFPSCCSTDQLREYGMDLSDLRSEEEAHNMVQGIEMYANLQELGTLSKKRKYTGCIEDMVPELHTKGRWGGL